MGKDDIGGNGAVFHTDSMQRIRGRSRSSC
jgi:hypothetical protein